jgi:hypothetical protein
MLFLFVLLAVLTAGAHEVKLSTPTLVADDQGIRIDLQLDDRSLRGRVRSVIACSSIDEPFFAIDWQRRNETGCSSPGFRAETIYTEQMAHDSGSLATKFAVRQTGLALYVRRRLIDRHSAVVYLEVSVHLQNALGETLQSRDAGHPDWTLVSRFTVPERSVRLALPGEPEASSVFVKGQQGVIESQIDHYVIGSKYASSDKEDPVTKDTAEKASYWHGMHWISTAGLAVIGIIVVSVGVATLVVFAVKLRHRRRMSSSHGDYAMQRRVSSGNAIKDLFAHASFQGLVDGCINTGKDPRHMV